MSDVHEWAARWNIPVQALHELRDALAPPTATSMPGKSEAAVQAQVRLEASQKGCRLFRNQVGAMYDATGQFIRFGLANDTHGMNKKIKSGDLIGIRPVIITPAHVGRTIGQFLSRECKHGDWTYKGDEHEIAQMAWAQLIVALGGDAGFANGEGTI
jgi:hypothetical protein